jgi:hypothetical protein
MSDTTLNIADVCGYAGLAVSKVSGLDHLEHQMMSILANGVVLDSQTVNSGQVDLGDSYSVVHVGLPFYADLQTLAVEVPLYEGTVQSRKVKINNVTFRMQNTRGGYIGSDADNLWEAFSRMEVIRSSGQNLSVLDLFTGDVRQPLIGQYNQGGNIFYRQVDPLPVTIGAIIPEVAVGGQTR